jgi:hypothetical protein
LTSRIIAAMAAAWIVLGAPPGGAALIDPPASEAVGPEASVNPAEDAEGESAADRDEVPLAVAIEALGAEWLGAGTGHELTLRQVLRSQVDHQREVADREYTRLEAEMLPDLPGVFGLRDALLESEFLGMLADKLIEASDGLGLRADDAVATFEPGARSEVRGSAGAPAGGLPGSGSGVVRQPGAAGETQLFSMVLDFAQGPFGIALLVLVGTIIVVRVTVKVGLVFQRLH